MRNLLLTLCFDGTNYHGWQIQKNALSVQEEFQNALYKILKDEKIDIKGCSRTDSGVHANMYCVSMKINSMISCKNLKGALNNFLPHDIAVNSVQEVPLNFHARYSCSAKEYIYKIWNAEVKNPFLYKRTFHYWYPLDVELLNKAAKYFEGSHDFTSFCTFDNRRPNNMVRSVKSFRVERENNLVTMRVMADGFLYNMVRIMVGTLLRVSMGKFKPCDIPLIIAKKDRSMAGPTAQACGLYLNRVFYEDVDFY